jgi:hypothetical protein
MLPIVIESVTLLFIFGPLITDAGVNRGPSSAKVSTCATSPVMVLSRTCLRTKLLCLRFVVLCLHACPQPCSHGLAFLRLFWRTPASPTRKVTCTRFNCRKTRTPRVSRFMLAGKHSMASCTSRTSRLAGPRLLWRCSVDPTCTTTPCNPSH